MEEKRPIHESLISVGSTVLGMAFVFCILDFTPIGPAWMKLFYAICGVVFHPITLILLLVGGIGCGIVGLVWRHVSFRRMLEEWFKKQL